MAIQIQFIYKHKVKSILYTLKSEDIISILQEIERKYYKYKRPMWPPLQQNWVNKAQFTFMDNTVSGDLISAKYLLKCTKIVVHVMQQPRTAFQTLQQRKFIPQRQTSYTFHKGDCGRPLIVAGSAKYHGAAFLAAMSAMRAGADYTYLLTRAEKLQAISSMSPDLIVQEFKNKDQLMQMPFTSIVIGPGLDRDEWSKQIFEITLEVTKEKQIPIVIDADGLYFVIQMLQQSNFDFQDVKAILTPNHREFNNLYKAVFGCQPENYNSIIGESSDQNQVIYVENASKDVANLSQKLQCIVIVKNLVDIITYCNVVKHTVDPGSPRRCSGQGDILSGIAGTLIGPCDNQIQTINACLLACEMVKKCNQMAYNQFGHGAVTSDFIKFIPQAYAQLTGTASKTQIKLQFK